MNERDRIIDTIKKCLALGDRDKNPHEGEVENALRMAKNLMDKHNLSMADVAEKEGDSFGNIKEESMKERAGAPRWEYELPWVCDALFNTKHFSRINPYRTERRAVVFVGYETDVTLAVEVYKLLKLELMQMGLRWSKANPSPEMTPKQALVRRFKYVEGVVDTLRYRANRMSDEMSKADAAKVTALVVRKDKQVAEFVKAKYELTSRRQRYTDNNADAREAGESDGRKVSLDFKKHVKDDDRGPRNMLKAFEL